MTCTDEVFGKGRVRAALDACARRLDGRPAAATTARRKRAVFHLACGYAVERGLLAANPVDRVQWKAPEVAETVDRRVVANPAQMRALLAAVRAQGPLGRRLEAFFGCLYYAGMRPSEAVALRAGDCVLPRTGWGRIDLAGSEPRAGTAWTDNGRSRQARGLKHRASSETRSVPIPPALVRLLRAHLRAYGPGPDGRVFTSARGNPLHDGTYATVWRRARAAALSPAQAASPLARRPYDLRHAAVSLWLNAGVPVTEVARRAGHGIAVLLKVYANCIDGHANTGNDRITDALNDYDQTQDDQTQDDQPGDQTRDDSAHEHG
jgi:integrase